MARRLRGIPCHRCSRMGTANHRPPYRRTGGRTNSQGRHGPRRACGFPRRLIWRNCHCHTRLPNWMSHRCRCRRTNRRTHRRAGRSSHRVDSHRREHFRSHRGRHWRTHWGSNSEIVENRQDSPFLKTQEKIPTKTSRALHHPRALTVSWRPELGYTSAEPSMKPFYAT